MIVRDNVNRVIDAIREACSRSRRQPSEVTLIGVAKGQPVEKIIEALQAGLTDIGENYAQEFLEHAEGAGEVRWHFIGHLQRNKVRQIIDKTALIHSVDSQPLAREIDRRAASIGRCQPILIEINLSGESSKAGTPPDQVEPLVREIEALSHVSLRGLMTMPPYSEDPESSRPFFRKLREIRDAINTKKLYKEPLKELSMGMTGDFKVAIEEGATMVRIGTGIFGERTKN